MRLSVKIRGANLTVSLLNKVAFYRYGVPVGGGVTLNWI